MVFQKVDFVVKH